MKGRIIEIVELGQFQSLIQRENAPITELIETNLLIEELNEQLHQPLVSGELADFARFLSEEYSIEIHERIIDEWNKYYSANYR